MQRTILESSLFIFLTFQMVITIFILISSNVEFTLFGADFEAYAIFGSLILLNCYLIYKMFKPNVFALTLGVILFGIYIFELTWSAGLFAFSLGFQVNFYLFEYNGINVSLNLGNLVLFIMFAIALQERLSLNKSSGCKHA
jgi:hypothetical protein